MLDITFQLYICISIQGLFEPWQMLYFAELVSIDEGVKQASLRRDSGQIVDFE